MNKLEALYTFFSQFGTAYIEGNVSDKAVLPYLTYSVSTSNFEDHTVIQVFFYEKSTSFSSIFDRANAFLDVVRHGYSQPFDGGCFIFNSGSPEMQIYPTQEKDTKVIYCTVDVQTLTE